MTDAVERLAVAIRDVIRETLEQDRVQRHTAPTANESLPPAAIKDGEPPRRRLYPLDEAREQLGGISRTTLWQLVTRRELEAVKLGRRTFIPASSLDQYVQQLRGGASSV